MISVCLASYNGEKYIERQLDSILNQNLPVDEVIICDDRSTDGTVQICKDFIRKNNLENWNVYVNDKNVGFCLNFYGAIEKSKGDYIFVCDQDDEWLPSKTEEMVKTLKNNPDIKVLSSRYDVIDENSEIIENSGVTYLGDKFDGSIEYLTEESFIGCSYIRGFSLCFTADIKKYIKKIDLKDLMAHDWLICMIGCIVGKTAVLNTKLAHYRYHLDNVSLSAMNKQNRKRSIEKRIRGIKQSVEGHSYIMTLSDNKQPLKKFIDFENKRIKFLERKNIFTFISLGFSLKQYNRYYMGNGLRVYLGDFAYAFGK